MSNSFDEGLDGRRRDENGQTRAKNGNTRVDTLRETYPGFAPGYRGDAHLDTVLDNEGFDSLSQYLRHQHNNEQ